MNGLERPVPITFERPSSVEHIDSDVTSVDRETLPDAKVPSSSEALQEQSAPSARQKTKRAVRFLITEEGDVVSERVRFEKHGTARSKAAEAIECLLAGNQRFQEGTLDRCRAGAEVLADTAGDISKPSTVILSCSDSRVPPEIICDQGLGDCHVVRVAGNVVNDFVMGSILFAVQHLGCRLVMVLGHSRCSVVASAVQTWARNKSLTRESQSVRSLAEGVQHTLGAGPPSNGNPQSPQSSAQVISPKIMNSDEKHQESDLECVTSVKETTSPFHSEAQRIPDDHRSKPSFFTRFCGCGNDEPTSEESSSNAASRQDNSYDGRRKGSADRRFDRSSIGRTSINPLNLLVGAIGGVVETVANSGEHDSFKTLVHKESRGRDNGWDSDDEDLKRGLTKQDSMEFTRARLAKKKADRKIEHLRELAQRADVDSVIDENCKVSAATILKSLVKNVDAEIVQEMEVAAAKYHIHDGSLKILGRSWYSNGTYYSTLES